MTTEPLRLLRLAGDEDGVPSAAWASKFIARASVFAWACATDLLRLRLAAPLEAPGAARFAARLAAAAALMNERTPPTGATRSSRDMVRVRPLGTRPSCPPVGPRPRPGVATAAPLPPPSSGGTAERGRFGSSSLYIASNRSESVSNALAPVAGLTESSASAVAMSGGACVRAAGTWSMGGGDASRTCSVKHGVDPGAQLRSPHQLGAQVGTHCCPHL